MLVAPHEWYSKPTHTYVTVFARDIRESRVKAKVVLRLATSRVIGNDRFHWDYNREVGYIR